MKRVLSNCVVCRRHKAPLEHQQMAPVWDVQVEKDDPPFTHIGIDLFGPLLVKQGRSTVKRYGCLFTCLAMHAVHLEVAHSLSADSFLAALSRFMACRGTPKKIYSDNATNLKVVYRELREGLAALNQTAVRPALLQKCIEWHYNPHMPATWEASGSASFTQSGAF